MDRIAQPSGSATSANVRTGRNEGSRAATPAGTAFALGPPDASVRDVEEWIAMMRSLVVCGRQER